VTTVTLTRKDAAATALTTLVVVAFLATHEGWDVPLIGDSHRWAAGVILLLGALTCGLGTPAQRGPGTMFLALVGIAAGVLGVLALVTGSLTALSLLVSAIVLLWAGATLRHALHHGPRRPIAA
jgi:hypothetical protein